MISTKEKLKRKFIKWLGYDVEHLNEELLKEIEQNKELFRKLSLVHKEVKEL